MTFKSLYSPLTPLRLTSRLASSLILSASPLLISLALSLSPNLPLLSLSLFTPFLSHSSLSLYFSRPLLALTTGAPSFLLSSLLILSNSPLLFPFLSSFLCTSFLLSSPTLFCSYRNSLSVPMLLDLSYSSLTINSMKNHKNK